MIKRTAINDAHGRMVIRTIDDARDINPGDGTVYVHCPTGQLSEPEYDHLEHIQATYIRVTFSTGIYYQIVV